eukprot:TRINITY_DN8540_c0_g1_i3.p2 TRINITY_DN8540_c0_g1~~TRINITY_DN8540_c0_g1_i3.p2  ORF type:complete len:331 (+),score=77.02 TRINITY_DN8540_c0_g1_i3:1333-2325(+)
MSRRIAQSLASNIRRSAAQVEARPLSLHSIRCMSDNASQAAPKSSSNKQQEEIGGPVGQLIKAWSWVKGQVVEDNVHYEKAQPYQPPVDRRRSSVEKPIKKMEANETDTGVVMHQESRWESQWANFRDNNPVMNRLFDLQMRYDESDNVLVRGARSATDAFQDRISQIFENDESGAVLAEIAKLDPTFDKLEFTLRCERKIIPAVLEAFVAGDREALKEWCAEVCYKAMEANLDDREQQGLHLQSQILDISDVEYITAQRMDEGPVLVFIFNAQQTHCVRDRSGAIIEGSEDNVQQSMYMFAMRRNPAIFDPVHAWQVLEMNILNSTAVW